MEVVRAPRTNAGLAPWHLRLIDTYLDERLDEVVRMADLVEATGLSTSHFSRAFKRAYGEKFSAYVIQCRLTRAKKMMLATDCSIGAVAVACGFSDQPHFNRLFRREEGISPRAWRKLRADIAA
ncbi:Transcriptional regulator, AraC family [Labilithrix luteola]|uniref:Transcriptional regulator, AraC family n=1 Tax=Labilithrix luteola TaxID=1391654 RepID=A0A0K1PWF5_9BACT|nr:AraC family transcriptional regulator [Labilithrix luteola]AKU97858.1 Transcriptional regulator, AraC family [Labilithrix luteola]